MRLPTWGSLAQYNSVNTGLLEHWPWLVFPTIAAIGLDLVARRGRKQQIRRSYHVVWGTLFALAVLQLGFAVFLVWFGWGFAETFRASEAFVLLFTVVWTLHALRTLGILRSPVE